jgi:hypothetical protein
MSISVQNYSSLTDLKKSTSTFGGEDAHDFSLDVRDGLRTMWWIRKKKKKKKSRREILWVFLDTSDIIETCQSEGDV